MKIETGGEGFGGTMVLFVVLGFIVPEILALFLIVFVLIWIADKWTDAQLKQADSSSKLVFRVPEISAPTVKDD